MIVQAVSGEPRGRDDGSGLSSGEIRPSPTLCSTVTSAVSTCANAEPMLHAAHQLAVGHTVAGRLVSDQHLRHGPQPPQQLTKEPGSGLGVTPGRDQNVQHGAVLVDRTPQVVGLAVDLDEHLVQVPLIAWPEPTATQPVREGLTELKLTEAFLLTADLTGADLSGADLT